MNIIYKIVIPAFILAMVLLAACNRSSGKDDDAYHAKVEELLSKMTLEEKVGQTIQLTNRWEMTGPPPEETSLQQQLQEIKAGRVGAMLNVTGAKACYNAQKLVMENSRLQIPMIFGYDVVHGYQTMFPVPLGIASSWEPDMAELSARVAATEATSAGINWTFAPMVDLSRDARWGRVMEGAGEDPYLASLMGKAYVHGFQGGGLSKNNTMAACAKHYAAYGFAIAGKDYNSVDISNNTLFNFVLPSFKACSGAGVATVMNSFNTLNGVPATGSEFLLRDILKGKWDFKGFVVSDWASIEEMINHGYAYNKADAAEKALRAGSDMDMEGGCYAPNLEKLIEGGMIDEQLLDDAVRRILQVKYELGLFHDPYKYCDSIRESNELLKAENLLAARKVARRSMVLLKNENNILPLPKSGKSIALIGPLADDKDSPLGSWRARAIKNSAVSLLEGMQNVVTNPAELSYARGLSLVEGEATFQGELRFNTQDRSEIPQALRIAAKADVVVMALGENCFQTGEGRSQVDISLKGLQMDLFRAVYAVNKNIVVVLMNGRPLAIPEIDQKAMAILEAWHPGSEGGNAIADVIFGDYNPSGKLPMSFPRHVGQLPLYYNHLSTGRPTNRHGGVFWSHYTDHSNEALYPFGYGLSYTDFVISTPQISADTLKFGEDIEVDIMLENKGKHDGEEVVQLYLQDVTASVAQPVRRLVAFKKVFVKSGEQKKVHFRIAADALGFYNDQYEKVTEAGMFRLFAGSNSRDVQQASFYLSE